MKQISTLKTFSKAFALMATLFVAILTNAQSPDYSFENPVLESGTAGNINAVYRFPNVHKNDGTTDALVTIKKKVGNITLTNIDRTADGYQEAFQPQYSISSNNTAYLEFEITFVAVGTNTPVALSWLDASALDIDGSTSGGLTLKEFNSIDMGGGYATYSTVNSELTVSQTGSEYLGANYTGVLWGALVDTAAKGVMFTVSGPDVTTFTYKVGSTSLLTGSSTRYASLYFKKFDYPNAAVLALHNLASFSGSANDGKASLKWSLMTENDVRTTELEKSSDGQNFHTVAGFTGSSSNGYTDKMNFSGMVYYRLKLTNADNKVEYSNVLKFYNQQAGAGTNFSVFPTLINSEATLNYQSDNNQLATVLVTDMSGRAVKKENIQLQQGINSVRLAGFEQFNKGAYIISISTPEKREARQVILQ